MLVLGAALLGLSAVASARCGTSRPSEAHVARHEEFQQRELLERSGPMPRSLFNENIDTYIHIIKATNATHIRNDTAVTKQIKDQMSVLNQRYSDAGFTFTLKSVNTFYNSSWLNIEQGSPSELEMKSSLRKGSYQDLNLYLDTIGDGTILGYATFPDVITAETVELDGVVIKPNTLPGGEKPYDLGFTAVHEVGHWLNLFHTFESHGSDDLDLGGCFGPGDYIYDTPAEGRKAEGCTPGRDTCFGHYNETANAFSEAGPDPIHNFMDYSDDACLNQFTAGQMLRMQTSFTELRKQHKADPEHIRTGGH